MKLIPPTLIVAACILLSACSLHTSLGQPEAVDSAARADIQKIMATFQALGPEIQKAIQEAVNKGPEKTVKPK